jgi:hypothetical protein
VKRDGVALREGSEYHYDPANHKLTIPFQKAAAFVIDGATGTF